LIIFLLFLEKLPPRCFPISQPVFPQRKRDSDIPISLGFRTLVHRLAAKNEEDSQSTFRRKKTL